MEPMATCCTGFLGCAVSDREQRDAGGEIDKWQRIVATRRIEVQ